MGLGPSIVSLFLAVSRHVTRTHSEKALEMMGQGPSYGFLAAPPRYARYPWVRPADLQDDAEKCILSLPHSTARIEAQQSGVVLFPDEEPGSIVPPGTADNSPPFQRWDKRRSVTPQVPEGRLRPHPKTRFSRPYLLDICPTGGWNTGGKWKGGRNMIVCFGEKAINSPQDRPPRHTGGTYVTISGTGYGKRGAFSHH